MREGGSCESDDLLPPRFVGDSLERQGGVRHRRRVTGPPGLLSGCGDDRDGGPDVAGLEQRRRTAQEKPAPIGRPEPAGPHRLQRALIEPGGFLAGQFCQRTGGGTLRPCDSGTGVGGGQGRQRMMCELGRMAIEVVTVGRLDVLGGTAVDDEPPRRGHLGQQGVAHERMAELRRWRPGGVRDKPCGEGHVQRGEHLSHRMLAGSGDNTHVDHRADHRRGGQHDADGRRQRIEALADHRPDAFGEIRLPGTGRGATGAGMVEQPGELAGKERVATAATGDADVSNASMARSQPAIWSR